MRLAVLVTLIAALASPAVARGEDDDRSNETQDRTPLSVTLGSPVTGVCDLDASIGFWWATLKRTSDASLGSRGSEPRYTQDLGFPEQVAVGVARIEIRLGVAGWLGTEAMVLPLGGAVEQLNRFRQYRGTRFESGDVISSRASMGWFRAWYGYEFRVGFPVADVPIEIAVSPTFGMGLYDVNVSLRRVAPNPGRRVAGRVLASTFAPGIVGSIEVWRTFKIGCEFEGILAYGKWKLAPRKPAHTEWERLRVYGGVRLFERVEMTVGWRHQNSSVSHADMGPDVKLRGFDVTVGVHF